MRDIGTRSVRTLYTLILAFGSGLLSVEANAGDLFIYEAGQKGAGPANAGATALAIDPSVMIIPPPWHPHLQGTPLSADAQVMLGHQHCVRDGKNLFEGNEGGNAPQWLAGASLFVSQQFDERLAVGFGRLIYTSKVNFEFQGSREVS